MRVLLVEDEPRLAENLAAALREGAGFAVDHGSGIGHLDGRRLLQAGGLVDDRLACVVANRIVGNKDGSGLRANLPCLVRLTVRLRVEHLVVVARRWQQGLSGDGAIECGHLLIREGRGKDGLICLRPPNRLVEMDNRAGLSARGGGVLCDDTGKVCA